MRWIEYFASRNKILYVHFRNVSAPNPNEFHEEFINTGYVDMVKAMKTYKDAGFDGCFMDDHCPDIYNDQEFPGNLGGADLEYSPKATYKDYWIQLNENYPSSSKLALLVILGVIISTVIQQ